MRTALHVLVIIGALLVLFVTPAFFDTPAGREVYPQGLAIAIAATIAMLLALWSLRRGRTRP